MRTSEVLNTAADLIEERGWIQGRHVSPEGFCAMGAIRAAAGTREDSWAPMEGPEWYAGLALCNYVGTAVAVWNDREGRVATQVIEALRAAAIIEAGEGRRSPRRRVPHLAGQRDLGMSVEWGNHWGDPTHHDIVHLSETGSDVEDRHAEKVDD